MICVSLTRPAWMDDLTVSFRRMERTGIVICAYSAVSDMCDTLEVRARAGVL